jgi:hypothetical protein
MDLLLWLLHFSYFISFFYVRILIKKMESQIGETTPINLRRAQESINHTKQVIKILNLSGAM